MTVRGYLLGVDWFAVGDPAGTGEDDTSDVLSDPDIVVGPLGRDTTQAGSMAPTGKMSFALRNDLRRYSIDNVSSPLFGRVLPGRRVQLQHTMSGSTVKLFDGVLDEGTADTTSKTFTADCSDSWGRPSAEKLSTAVYRGIRTGDAINIVLDAIGWEGAREIDLGATVMPWWWEEDTDAASAIEKLVNSEGPPALAYVQGGTFVFEDRFHRLLTPASQTSQGLFTHIIPAGSGPAGDFKILKDSFTYDNGLKGIVNSATFTVDERAAGEYTEVWVSESPIVVPAGGSIDVFVSTSDPFISAVAPSLEPPFPGVGSDVPLGGIIASDTTVSASISRDSGQSLIITLSAPTTIIVSRLALTAKPVTVIRSVKVSAEDTASINTHGRSTWAKDAPWANGYDAQALCDRIMATYARPRPVVTFDIAGLDATYMAQIRGRQLSDRITIRNDEIGLNSDFIIEQLTHTIRNLGRAGTQDHRLTIVAEVPQPDQPINTFRFDQATNGFNDGLFGVDGIDNADTLFMFDSAALGRLSVGAFLSSSALGASDFNGALANWTSITGLPVAVTRWYQAPGDFSIGASNLAQMVNANIKVCLTLRPDYNPVNPAHLVAIDSMLATLQSSGADIEVTLWHEPFFSGLSAAQYVAMVQYYGPIVQTYYRLWAVFSGSDANVANGYYPGDAYVDGVAVDAYAASGTTQITNAQSIADAGGKPFGVWEFNGGADLGQSSAIQGQSQSTVTTHFQYIQNLFIARVVAGKPNGDLLLFSSGTNGSSNFLGTSLSANGGFEGGNGNWISGSGTLANTSAQHKSGGFAAQITSPGGGGTSNILMCSTPNILTQGMPCSAGQVVAGMGWFRAQATGRACRMDIAFFDSSGAALSTITGSTVNDITTDWVPSPVTSGTAPANTARARLVPTVLLTGASEVHYFDDPEIAVLPASNDLTSPIQYPWDYRIALLSSMQTWQLAVQGFDSGRFGT